MQPNGPALWASLLDAIRRVTPTDILPVVCGGAIRDYALGVEPKDIDIFVNINTEAKLADLAVALASLGAIMVEPMVRPTCTDADSATVEAADYAQWGNGELIGVLSGTGFGYDVQIIARKSYGDSGLTGMFNWFDFAAVRAAYDGMSIVVTPEFIEDIGQRTCTFMQTGDEALSQKRFDRFEARHPGLLTAKGFGQSFFGATLAL